MAGLGGPSHVAAALADGLEDLLEPGDALREDLAPCDDRAHVDQDSVRNERAEVELLKRIVRLEDDDLRTEGQRGLDRCGVMGGSERCLDANLGT